MPLNDSQKELLKAELKSNGNKVAKAAAVLGLDLDEVINFVQGAKPTVGVPRPRPELEKYVVASTKAGGPWPNSPAVDQARFKYDAGLIELCQWRDGDTIHLLAIPRKKPAQRRSYFRFFDYEGE